MYVKVEQVLDSNQKSIDGFPVMKPNRDRTETKTNARVREGVSLESFGAQEKDEDEDEGKDEAVMGMMHTRSC